MKWYEMRFGDTTLDARPFGPFSLYLFFGEAIRRWKNGEKPLTKREIAAALGASTSVTGTIDTVAGKLYDFFMNGEFEKAQRLIKQVGGAWGKALLTPVRQVKDLIAAFDSQEAIVRDTDPAPFTGPMAESVPYASQRLGLQPAHLPTTATPIHQERPGVAFSGWRVETPKTFLQGELDDLHFEFNEIRSDTGNPAIDDLEKRLMGPLMDELSRELEADEQYRSEPRAVRKKVLKDILKGIREDVREMGEAENPELYQQHREDRKPRDEKEFEKEASPGLSSALRLGVPVPVPQRRPGEDDLAYRARLIQAGRAQRSALDTVASQSGFSTLPTTQQRMRLHAALG